MSHLPNNLVMLRFNIITDINTIIFNAISLIPLSIDKLLLGKFAGKYSYIKERLITKIEIYLLNIKS